MNHHNGIYSWLLLVGLALAGCQERAKVTATDVECGQRLPAGDMEPEGSSSDHGMSYGRFQLGESARAVEDRIAQHREWMGVSRAACNGRRWFVRAGTVAQADSSAACNVYGKTPCELVMATMEKATAGTHVLTNLTYAQRLEGNGRPTQSVLDEFKANYGKPWWSYAARQSAGWSSLIEETRLIWSAPRDEMSRRLPDSNFQEEVIKQLGAGDYLIVTLIHNDDHRVTYGMTVELRRVSAASIQDPQTTRGSRH